VTFESGENFEGLLMSALADQKTGRIRKERTHGIDAEREEELESQRKAPSDILGSK
jgi:hypothetical protein